ncbi:hypothetical protein ACIGKR_31950 [Rhodococcus qingshengii]
MVAASVGDPTARAAKKRTWPWILGSDNALADDDIRHDYGGGVFYNVGA